MFLGSRITLFGLVVLIHVVTVVALFRNPQRPRFSDDGGAILVSIRETPRVSAEPVQLEVEWREPQILVPAPEVLITLPVEQPLQVSSPSPAQPPSQPPPDVAAEVGNAPRMVTPADYLRPPAPRYPVLARQARQQGTVLVRVWIDAEGKPKRVELERSSGQPLLDRAAITAVREALFRPFVEAGIARAVRVLIPIEFSLNQRVASR
jgi:periplasmic protein TonB